MSKVVLTKAQAEALELAIRHHKNEGNSKDYIVQLHIERTEEEMWADTWSPLNELSLDTLIRALYIGYDVEQTLEEELAETYHNHKTHFEARWGYYADGIKYAVDKLGHEIKGINA